MRLSTDAYADADANAETDIVAEDVLMLLEIRWLLHLDSKRRGHSICRYLPTCMHICPITHLST